MILDANFYDGKSSKKYSVKIEFNDDKTIRVVGEEIEINSSLDEIKISSRLGNTPRVIELSEHRKCICFDNRAIDNYLKKHQKSIFTLHSLERSFKFAMLSFVSIIIITALFIEFGIPYFSKVIAFSMPDKVQKSIGKKALAYLDERVLQPTQLTTQKQDEIRQIFHKAIDYDLRYKLHFRRGIGTNAFALPSGDIIITDEMVNLCHNKKAIFGVFAHEKAHVIYRHSLQSIFQASFVSMIITYLTGDINSVVVLLPTLLVQASYSRDFEREADLYAIKVLKDNNISPKHLAKLFEKLQSESKTSKTNGLLKYISTHPETDERIEMLRN